MATKKAPAWLLERVAQGELDDTEVAELRARLAAEGRSLEEALEKLRQSDRETLTRLPREMMAAAIRRRAATDAIAGPRSRLRMLSRPLALTGTLALLILGARSLGDGGSGRHRTSRSLADEVTVIKGREPSSPRLLVYRQRAGRASAGDFELLADGAQAARGDLLQLAYDQAPAALHGVLLSVDGGGKVTLHLPEEGARQAAPLASLREIRLPSAYELDDAPGFERFLLVTASQPFTVQVVLDAAHALARRRAVAGTEPLPLAPRFRQISVLLHKREGTP